MSESSVEISVILPTYNERETIGAVVRDIVSVAHDNDYAIEVLIVDDNSPDGTGKEAERLTSGLPVHVIHRRAKLGLGGAVIEGLAAARGRIWGVMDADGSHPAEVLPRLIDPIREGRVQLSLASRYVEGGAVEYWPRGRRMLSRLATLLARLFKPGVKDPLSGFLFFDRSVVEGVPLSVTGYKIGLEILIKGRYNEMLEAPYTFRNREIGHSKLGWSEYLNYLNSLARHTLFCVRNRKERRAFRRAARLRKVGPHDDIALRGERLWGPCPLCEADNSAALFVKNTYRYAACRVCGLVFVNPMPCPAELESIYQDPRYFANRNEWAYGYNNYLEERAFYDPLFRRRLIECERALGAKDGSGRRLLDVGCAAGYLLDAARERGWDATGVELSRHAADFANERLGGAVRCGTLAEARFETDSFDCVVMLDILEHVSDPVGLLREAARVLRPGGVLLLSVPDAKSLSARLFGRRWFHFKRDHVVLFTRKTLLRAIGLTDLLPARVGRNGKMVSLNYLFARIKTYIPLLGRLLHSTVGRLGLCNRLFYDSMTGEMLAVCRQRTSAGEPPPPEEVYGRMRARYWRPTAFWRASELFRLHGVDAEPPVLDLGSGDGFFARHLFPTAARKGMVGVDLRHNELLDLHNAGDGARAVVADATALPFRAGAFRFVLANCSLEHVEGIERATAEIGRVLRPGGRLAFTVPSGDFNDLLFFSSLFSRLRLRSLARAYGRLMDRGLNHRNILASERWRELLEAAGLRIERTEHFMPPRLARMWDRRWWVGMPRFLLAKLLGFTRYRRLRPCPLPGWNREAVREQIIGASATGAGAVYFCLKLDAAPRPSPAKDTAVGTISTGR